MDADGFASITIRCYGTSDSDYKFVVTMGGQDYTLELAGFSRNTASSGYLSLVSGNCKTEFKDVRVARLNADGTAA